MADTEKVAKAKLLIEKTGEILNELSEDELEQVAGGRVSPEFVGEDLSAICSRAQQVVLIKHTAESKRVSAWVTFNPFETNTIDWENQFSLYQKTGELQNE
jgi:bacteriocin-like protein